jgi:xylulokinase
MISVGIDVGTSAVKVALVQCGDGGHEVLIAQASRALAIDRPRPGYSEQDPIAWWEATQACIDELQSTHPSHVAACGAMGLSGQMHGATLIDATGQVLRPCILWNDTRSQAQCATLEATWPALREVTGNLAMPGFTAPKLLWIREHEPALFERIDKVLLPKAYVRLQLCGEAVEDMSDASGTLWLDVGRRCWSRDALSACGLTVDHMPRLVEGSDLAGRLRPALARRWGMATPPLIAGGAGDNAAGAVAVGAVQPGEGFVSLGTSGVIWATTAAFALMPARAVHAFCHALPARWHQMGVLLNAAACLAWWARTTGKPESDLLSEIAPGASTGVAFLPYLSGERTPHNDAHVRGGFLGIDAADDRASMTLAVLEGVAYAMRDARDALAAGGTRLAQADLIGGGARSPLWCQLMADVLGMPLHTLQTSELGCAIGAARLAFLAATGTEATALGKPPRTHSYEPRAAAADAHTHRFEAWRPLFGRVRDFSFGSARTAGVP